MKAPFVTFYSFKGGVGRTMALTNVGAQFAGRGFRTLLVDFDLEAPGLSYLQPDDTPGLVDLLLDARERGAEADLFMLPPGEVVARYSREVTLPDALAQHPGGFLRLMPAGRLSPAYSANLDRLALGQLYLDGEGRPLVQAFKEIVQEAELFDVVLVDSRTGFSDESGICTRDLADAVVVILGLNRQNREGTAAFLQALSAAGRKPITVAMSPVPLGEEDKVQQAEEEAASALSEAWGAPLKVAVQIPYHPALALSEDLRAWHRGALAVAYEAMFGEVRALIGWGTDALMQRVREAARRRDLEGVVEAARRLGRLEGRLDAVLSNADVLELLEKDGSEALHALFLEEFPVAWWGAAEVAAMLTNSRVRAGLAWHERALKLNPSNGDVVGNYALFQYRVLGDIDTAHRAFVNAVSLGGRDEVILTNHAVLLHYGRRDFDAAEEQYRRAVEVAPDGAQYLSNYAIFLSHVRHDHAQAETVYRQALAGRNVDANVYGNYAQLLLHQRRTSEALPLLERAWAEVSTEELKLELLFYTWAHQLPAPPNALPRLLTLLRNGVRSRGWVLEDNVRVAIEDGHPRPELVPRVAAVIAGAEDLLDLEAALRRGGLVSALEGQGPVAP
jgi:Tfp pilus assembly protein PilF/MinD-like ATPase involved in chromosome partitioning or flagellar assembly